MSDRATINKLEYALNECKDALELAHKVIQPIVHLQDDDNKKYMNKALDKIEDVLERNFYSE